MYRISSCDRIDVLLRNCLLPNGLILDVLQSSLSIAMSRDNNAWLALLYSDGIVQRTGRFSSYLGTGGPDGLAVDEEGNLFVANSTLSRIFVHRKEGWHVGNGTTNLTCGGEGLRRLYIVESESASVLVLIWHCGELL